MTSRQVHRNPSQVDEQGNLIHPTQNLGAPGTTGAAGTADPLGAPGSTGAYNTTYQPAGMTQGGGQQQPHRPTGGFDEQDLSGGGDRHDGSGLTGGTGGAGSYDAGFGGGRHTEGGGTTMGDLLGSSGDGYHTAGGGVTEGYTTTGKGRTDLTGGKTGGKTGVGEYGTGERKHTRDFGTAGTGVGGGGGTDYGTGMLGTAGMPDTGSGGVKWDKTTEATIPSGTKTGIGSDVGGGHEPCEGEKKGLMDKVKDHIPGTGSGRTR